jgi:hypothetical protein
VAAAATLADAMRIKDYLTLGSLTRYFPLKAVNRVLQETDKSSIRVRVLPASIMVYYVMAMVIYMGLPYREVLRQLLENASNVFRFCRKAKFRMPAKSSIFRARERLGYEPLKRLHDELVKPIAGKRTKGARYRKWLVVSMDGSTIDVADTAENDEEFGRSKSDRGKSAFPKIRMVSLIENGTRVMFGTKFGGYAGNSEKKLAREVLPSLREGMLCLADRYYLGYAFLELALSTQADILWRASRTLKLRVEKRLSDGSFIAVMYRSKTDRIMKRNGIRVRVVCYQVKGFRERYRLVTSILDPAEAPAKELAELYHERWEIENSYDEFKTHLRGARMVLRSKHPDLVKQEVYGFLLAYFAVRGIMHEAALQADEDPDRLSFTHAIRVLRRRLPQFAATSPPALVCST